MDHLAKEKEPIMPHSLLSVKPDWSHSNYLCMVEKIPNMKSFKQKLKQINVTEMLEDGSYSNLKIEIWIFQEVTFRPMKNFQVMEYIIT